MRRQTRLSWLARLTMIGLIGTGLGFVGAGIDPGPGPRAVRGSLTIDHVYLPPFLVGIVTLGIASLILTRIRWMPAVGAGFAGILLIGAGTLGAASVSYRLTHPGTIGFLEDSLQLVGEAVAVVAGIAATLQSYRAERDV